MTIRDVVKQSLHYAWSCKSLWIFGFVVGLATGGSSSSGGSGGGSTQGGGLAGLPLALIMADLRVLIVPIVLAVVVVGLLAFLVHFISEAALIVGVERARHGSPLTWREGLRAGWAHWGVLMRIAIVYFAMVAASLVVLVVPCVLLFRALGVTGAILGGVPAAIVAAPWLITLHLVRAFAMRIAVLENRHAMDALRKARLFLHGRILHGLKLIVAAFVGTVVIAIPGVVAMLAVVLPMVLLVRVAGFAAIAICGLALVPIVFVFAAVLGTFRSSVWTIGYRTEVES